MDQIFGRRDMITPARLKVLTVKSDVSGFIQLGSHLGAIALSTVALVLTWGTWGVIPAFVTQGVLINFLYAGQHEMSHATVFRTKGLNETFGRLFGFVLIYPRDFDQIQHFAHHRFTQDWDGDGELGRDRYTMVSYLLWVLGPTYWYTRVRRIIRFTAGVVSEPYIPENGKADVIREARWHAAGYLALAALCFATGSWAAVTLWLVPMLALKPVHQLQNTIEHLGLPHVDAITENTRTTRTNALMRWMCWNMQFHTAHHAFPGVPCYKLPELHRTIFDENGRKPHTMGYLAFQWAVVKAFWAGRTEADYPDDAIWISDDTDLEPVARRVRTPRRA